MYGVGPPRRRRSSRPRGWRRSTTSRRSIALDRARCSPAHAGPVAEYRAGKTKTFGFLVGQVMKATAGKANPERVNELLKRALEA